MMRQIGDATLYVGDCRDSLRQMDAESVQCVVTSPPYYGLRDYGNDGQIGLEPTPDEYVAAMVDVFREVRRVLRDDGVVWLNLGDSYASGKNLIGIPWRVAFALQADGWYLRQDIIWHKPNPMPESVTDRCTKAHEYIFLLSKSARYFYDADAVKEEFADERMGNPGRYKAGLSDCVTPMGIHGKGVTGQGWNSDGNNTGRNRRSVWTIATQPYGGAHFATFPPKLIEPCILAGTPERGCCPHCGAPWERVVEVDRVDTRPNNASKYGGLETDVRGSGAGNVAFGLARRTEAKVTTTGHQPTCTCPDHEPVPSTVLDPFGGSGTTAAVALKHGRKAVLCELSEEYAALIPERINGITDALMQYTLGVV